MTTGDADGIRDVDPTETPPAEIDLDLVRAGLESENNLDRTQAAQVVSTMAAEDPALVEPLVPTLVGLFDDERTVVLKEVLFALSVLAEDDPDHVADDVGGLIDLLDHDVPLIRSVAARALRPVAVDRPAVFAAHVDDLLTVVERPVEDPTEGYEPDPNAHSAQVRTINDVRDKAERRQLAARAVAAHVVVAVADRDAAAVTDHVDRLADLLDDDSPAVTAAAADALASVAEDDPDAVAGVTDALIGTFDSPDDPTRASAVAVLGFVGDEAAVEPLRELADDDEADEDLRELAAETAAFVEDG
ncbi:HEAT repeat domain-containing protein [Halomicrobium salinisoli]|uniref:HEAT repeat domain-containing protein n=1 Tax=Halomicrobium salinisoli TaxID=2878391 RepID=UPI001CF0B5E0|nr:HEAT repeat domain-containing protein [Halomicrobium salinisoli]